MRGGIGKFAPKELERGFPEMAPRPPAGEVSIKNMAEGVDQTFRKK